LDVAILSSRAKGEKEGQIGPSLHLFWSLSQGYPVVVIRWYLPTFFSFFYYSTIEMQNEGREEG
jgi:hypothetical protein